MNRGDIVIAAAAGDYGKPRPYVVVQIDDLHGTDSVVLCPVSSHVEGATYRLQVQPGISTGLRTISEVMVEKIIAIRRDRVARVIGRLDAKTMNQLDIRLAFVLGLSA